MRVPATPSAGCGTAAVFLAPPESPNPLGQPHRVPNDSMINSCSIGMEARFHSQKVVEEKPFIGHRLAWKADQQEKFARKYRFIVNS